MFAKISATVIVEPSRKFSLESRMNSHDEKHAREIGRVSKRLKAFLPIHSSHSSFSCWQPSDNLYRLRYRSISVESRYASSSRSIYASP